MQVEANLQNPRENLQIPYPKDFPAGSKTHGDDENIVAGYEPRYYTEAEISLIEAFLPKLNYNQTLVLTGSVLVGNDALLSIGTQDELDKIEAANGFPNSRFIDADNERALRERVYIVRELGYRGLPEIAAPEAKSVIPETTQERKPEAKVSKAREVATA
jgi:hypothetical protein